VRPPGFVTDFSNVIRTRTVGVRGLGVFSRRERTFLGLVVECDRAGDPSQRALRRAFPNPVYRRKLMWGIRRKTAAAAADWALYTDAARVDDRVRPSAGSDPEIPLVAEPVAVLVRRVEALFRRSVARGRPPRLPRRKVDR